MSARTHTVESFHEFGLTVEYTFQRGAPAVMYLRNGDPGYPAEPDEIEIVAVRLNGHDIKPLLSDRFLDDLEEELAENHDDSPDDPDMLPGGHDNPRGDDW